VRTVLLLFTFASLAIGKTPPNILLIYTDDHAQWAVGAYGNKDVHTPTMDRLAAEGMRFTQGFTKAVCSPSRAMVLTGLYTHRLGIPDYIAYGNPVKEDVGLPAGTTTIASMLKQKGYATGLVGKWHLGYGPKYYPTNFGFDHAEGYRHIAPGKDPAGVGQIPFLIDGKEIARSVSSRRIVSSPSFFSLASTCLISHGEPSPMPTRPTTLIRTSPSRKRMPSIASNCWI